MVQPTVIKMTSNALSNVPITFHLVSTGLRYKCVCADIFYILIS